MELSYKCVAVLFFANGNFCFNIGKKPGIVIKVCYIVPSILLTLVSSEENPFCYKLVKSMFLKSISLFFIIMQKTKSVTLKEKVSFKLNATNIYTVSCITKNGRIIY